MIEIRQYRETDRHAVWALHNQALEGTGAHAGNGPWDDDLHEVRELYVEGGGDFLVGLIKDRVVAMGALRRVDSSVAEIKRMRVAPQAQRRGFGTAILIALEQKARELGMLRLVLETTDVQIVAQRFYEKNGFRETGRGQAHGFDVIYFHKDLQVGEVENQNGRHVVPRKTPDSVGRITRR